jgi:hypothetical protein
MTDDELERAVVGRFARLGFGEACDHRRIGRSPGVLPSFSKQSKIKVTKIKNS